jgi:gamma-glutamyltranspeptidase/glutathione hydrolase
MILERLDDIRTMPAAAAQLLRGGDPPHGSGYWGGGERLDTSALAATLRRIAEQGPAGFHGGPVADAIERAVAVGGGIITAADVAGYAPKLFRERPQRYRGIDYVTSNDQVGYEVLNILERFPVGEWGPDDPRFLHVLGEAFGCAFADNVTHYGDDEHTESPLEALASAAFAALRADAIRPDAVLDRPIQPADPWPFQPGGGAGEALPQAGGSRGTSQMTAIDESGMAAALITTIGHDFGSLVYVPEAGLFLNSSMVNFDPRPDRPNRIQAGKMPFFAVPAIVAARDGRGVFAAGGSGGYRILSGVVHAFVHHVDFGMGVRAAVDQPRVYCQGDELFVDERITPDRRRELEALGHRLAVEQGRPGYAPFARVSAVAAEGDGPAAASDPAWSTAAGVRP